MKRLGMMMALVLAACGVGCGQVKPELRVRSNGLTAEAFGDAKCAKCGSGEYLVTGRTFEHVHVRCLDCGAVWTLEVPRG